MKTALALTSRPGSTRYRHYLRQLALVVILGRPARHAVAWASGTCRRGETTLEESRRRRRRAQIAARRALDL